MVKKRNHSSLLPGCWKFGLLSGGKEGQRAYISDLTVWLGYGLFKKRIKKLQDKDLVIPAVTVPLLPAWMGLHFLVFAEQEYGATPQGLYRQ